jgi:hypothetical protein
MGAGRAVYLAASTSADQLWIRCSHEAAADGYLVGAQVEDTDAVTALVIDNVFVSNAPYSYKHTMHAMWPLSFWGEDGQGLIHSRDSLSDRLTKMALLPALVGNDDGPGAHGIGMVKAVALLKANNPRTPSEVRGVPVWSVAAGRRAPRLPRGRPLTRHGPCQWPASPLFLLLFFLFLAAVGPPPRGRQAQLLQVAAHAWLVVPWAVGGDARGAEPAVRRRHDAHPPV